jgi:hypothetical protein
VVAARVCLCCPGYSELLQPLLLVDSASADDLQHMQDQHSRCGASPLADVAGNKAWGVRAAQQSPDLTIHLGMLGGKDREVPASGLAEQVPRVLWAPKAITPFCLLLGSQASVLSRWDPPQCWIEYVCVSRCLTIFSPTCDCYYLHALQVQYKKPHQRRRHLNPACPCRTF